MNKYLVVRDSNQWINQPFISGKSGVQALNNVTPVHMVGLFKRIREGETPDVVLRHIVYKGGLVKDTPEVGYIYHEGRIEKQ